MATSLGIPMEVKDGECRVASPYAATMLTGIGWVVLAEARTGASVRFVDATYRSAWARTISDAE